MKFSKIALKLFCNVLVNVIEQNIFRGGVIDSKGTELSDRDECMEITSGGGC